MKMNPVTPNFTGMLKLCLPNYHGYKAEVAINANAISSIRPSFRDKVCINSSGGSYDIKAPLDKVLEAYLEAQKNGIACIVDADY